MLAIRKWNISLLSKEKCADVFLYTGMIMVFWGSMHPWFMWPLRDLYVIPASLLMILAAMISNSTTKREIKPTRSLFPLLLYTVVLYYMLYATQVNATGMIVNLFNIPIFYVLFCLKPAKLMSLGTAVSKCMACLLLPSIIAFLLFLVGFSLPSVNVTYGEESLYSYTNYFFFMLDDRLLTAIFPRFSSVFLEPGHLGTATVLLLMTQCGKWKKWYNVVLLIATLLSFSLAAYILLVVIIFLNMWMQKKHILKKMIAVIALLATVTIITVTYNNGNNILNDLIFMRMEVEDGEMSGDNRVTDDFKDEFDSFCTSSDLFLGRDMDASISGNSGYRVFIYEYGLVGLMLMTAFFIVILSQGKYKRAVTAVTIVSVLLFIVRAHMLWYCFFIPSYIMIFYEKTDKKQISS